MNFTDENLKRLKGAVSVHKNHSLFCDRDRDTYSRLLARLEAAEECIPYHECQDDLSTCPHLKNWRKAAGK